MNNKTKFMVAIVLACVFAFSALPVSAFANSIQTSHSIFNLTGEYGSQLHGNTLLQAESDEQPTITVFTHGMGGDASHWGGTVPDDDNLNSQFTLDSKSMPVLLKEKYDDLHPMNEAEIYIARSDVEYVEINIPYAQIGNTHYYRHEIKKNSTNNYFSLYKLEKENNYVASGQEPVSLSEVSFSTHTIIVYQDSGAWKSLVDGVMVDVGIEQEMRYNEFHFIIDAIVDASRLKNNQVPRINLIGHSLGGITNMMYANEHKYNVDSLVSLGTPYQGAWSADLALELGILTILPMHYIVHNYYDVMCDWNDNQTGLYVKTKLVSSDLTLPFVAALLIEMCDLAIDEIAHKIWELCVYLYNLINSSQEEVDLEYNNLALSGIFVPIIASALENNSLHDELEEIKDALNAIRELPLNVIEILMGLAKVGEMIDNLKNYLSNDIDTNLDIIGDALVGVDSQQARGSGVYENIPESSIFHYTFDAEITVSENNISYEADYFYNDGTIVNLLKLKSVPGMPAVGHNLQCRNPVIIEHVLDNIDMKECDYTYTPNNDSTHTRTCACGSVVEEHDYTYLQISQISPLNMQNGISPMAFILPLPSNNLYVHRATCTKCAYTTQLEHDWTEFGTGYKCGDCLLFATNIPIARPDNYFTLQQQIAIGTLLEGQTVAISDTEQVTLVGGVYYLSHVNVGLEPVLPPAEDC